MRTGLNAGSRGSLLASCWLRLSSFLGRLRRGGLQTTSGEEDPMKDELTLERRAELEIRDVLDLVSPAGPDDDKACWYAALFLLDYQIALNSPNTTQEHFLAAYGNRALSIRYCKPEDAKGRAEALDLEAYRLRQEWRSRS